jgi:hypothetical protein
LAGHLLVDVGDEITLWDGGYEKNGCGLTKEV